MPNFTVLFTVRGTVRAEIFTVIAHGFTGAFIAR